MEYDNNDFGEIKPVEIWADLKDPKYKGLYQVSSFGNIRSLDCVRINSNGTKHFVKGRVLTKPHDGQYKTVHLYDEHGNKKCISAHRLIAEAFCLNHDPEHQTQVNHIDGNKANNHPSNLEWVSCKANIQHAHDTALHGTLKGEDAPSAKLTTEQVIEARRRSKAGEYQASIAKDFGVKRELISTAVNGTYYHDVDKIEAPFSASERRPHGFAHSCSKFTPEQVADIKRRVQSGVSRASIAREFGVHRKTIERMCRGNTYTDDMSGISVTSARPNYSRFNSPSCLISRDEMPKILEMVNQGISLSEIAARYNTERHVVSRWIKWEHELRNEEGNNDK